MIDPVGLRSLVALERHGTVLATVDVLGDTPSAVSQFTPGSAAVRCRTPWSACR